MPGHANKKQAQRTKGNLRPSSSSQAAQLLTMSGTAQVGLLKFGQTPQYVPASSTLDDMDSSLDPDFRMVLRKLTKKDATTKIKGLQEFSDLCKDKPEDSLKAVLPFWPRTYNKMALDVNHRVRESAQTAMSTLVQRVRRNLAPYLKNLMGAWLLSQCDTYPTVSSAAQSSFQDAFPPAKQTEALVFCKDSIVEYMTENLVKHIPQTLSDPQTTDKDDMENKYNRVMTSSLLALRKLLSSLTPAQIDPLKPALNVLLDEAKFWKHAKSKVSSVRGAMYTFLAGLCQAGAELCTLYVNKIAPLCLHNLDEKDPAICGQLWELTLSLVNYVQECWKHINVQKAFWPKFKSVLESGCHGNAVIVSPNLLPLLSRIPDDLFPDNNKFYEDFFTCFRTGLASDGVYKSPSECGALVRAYMECAQYVVKQSPTSDTPKHIMLDQVKPVVEASLIEKDSPLSRSPLYGMLGNMLTGLEFSDHPASRQTASQYWTQLLETVQVQLCPTEESTKHTFFEERIVSLVTCLFYPGMETGKPATGKVRFGKVSEVNEKLPEVSVKDGLKVEKRKEIGESSRTFVQTVTLLTFELAHKHFSTSHLRIFAQLLELDPCDETVAKVISCCHGDVATETASHYFVFEICLPWLSKLQGDDSDAIVHLIHVVCIFIPVLEQTTVLTLLEKLYENCSTSSAEYALLQKLFAMSRSHESVRSWLQGTRFGEKLVNRVQAMCADRLETSSEDEVTSTLQVLSLVLATKGDNQEPVLDRKCVTELLILLLRPLTPGGEGVSPASLEKSLSFVSQASYSFFTEHRGCIQLVAGVDLLLTLFRSSLTLHSCPDTVQDETRRAWSVGVSSVVKDTGGYLAQTGLLARLAEAVRDVVQAGVTTTQGLCVVMETVKQLLDTVRSSLPEEEEEKDNPVYRDYCDMLMVPVVCRIPSKVWQYLCVRGDYPSTPSPDRDPTFPTHTLYTCLYNTSLLQNIHGPGPAPPDPGVTMETDWPDPSLACLLDCVQGASLIQLFIQEHRVVEGIPAVREAATQLQSSVQSLVNCLSNSCKSSLLELALSRYDSDQEGVLGLTKLVQCLTTTGYTVTLGLDALLDRVSTLSESGVYLVNCCHGYLLPADQATLLEIFVARILSVSTQDVQLVEGGLGVLCVLSQLVSGAGDQEQKNELGTGVIDQVLNWREEREDILLYNCDLRPQLPQSILLNAGIARYMTSLISLEGLKLTDKHWDFIMCSLVSWIESIEESQINLGDSPALQCFMVSLSDLLTCVSNCMRDRVPRQPESYPDNLLTEWLEFFSESVFSVMLPVFNRICGHVKEGRLPGSDLLCLSSLGTAVSHTPKGCVLEHKLPPLLVAGDLSPLPDNLQTLMNHVCPLLVSKERCVQLTAFSVLQSIISTLPQYDKEDKSLDVGATGGAEEEETSHRSPPSYLMSVVDDSSVAMEMLLGDMPIDSYQVFGYQSEGYHLVMAYLLSWKLLLIFFKSAPAELRQEYAGYFQEHGYIHRLVYHVFRLMPNNPGKHFQDGVTLVIKDEGSNVEVEGLACEVYQLSLTTMPAMVRTWWKEQDRKTSAYIDMFTTKQVSPVLCKAELQTVQVTDVKLDSMTVKARPSTREVIATYTLEEVSIEMVISLPQNYPLGNIQVISEKRVGVSGPQWEKWLLQLNIFLQHQNGNIMDGLHLWKNNIDKRFEGVDECMICFYVLHGTNFQLPKITCRTCKKKFHSICLYKWFNTSHNCTCPLCRNVF